MKAATDPRHKKREQKVKLLYTYSFSPKVIDPKIKGVVTKLDQIDASIATHARERPLNQINRIDLAILRLAVSELLFAGQIPQKVVIDEAVELAKTFGSDASPSFVNGVLGSLLSHEKPA
ncbi:MAG: transcription antitermination factor NusB [Candidatus Chisholmbacteria bacterium]|nr:transcription antitermination factor NusB [Candidatus Chisholmbacteria bacterium]